MKALTLTAIIGVLVAIPLIYARRSHRLAPISVRSDSRERDVNLLYDVDDFIEPTV